MSDPSAAFFIVGAVPLLATGRIYERGAWRRRGIARAVDTQRHVMFAAGLIAFFLSIEWPFADWEHQLFAAHQAGMLVARVVAPILIVLARPAGLLVAGMPRIVRDHVLRPGLSLPHVRRAWAALTHPASAIALYVALLYLWELPLMQAETLVSAAAGLAMHYSLLVAGLIFWAQIFARRAAPHAASHGWRLMMIVIAMLSQILLGAYLTSKGTIFYPAYASGQHAEAIAALTDEQTGGFLLWVPGSFLSVFAFLFTVDRFGRYETRMDERRTRWSPSNSAILLYPETARALRAMTRVKNRRMAIGMIGFAILVFSAAFGSAITSHRLTRRDNLRAYWASRS